MLKDQEQIWGGPIDKMMFERDEEEVEENNVDDVQLKNICTRPNDVDQNYVLIFRTNCRTNVDGEGWSMSLIVCFYLPLESTFSMKLLNLDISEPSAPVWAFIYSLYAWSADISE